MFGGKNLSNSLARLLRFWTIGIIHPFLQIILVQFILLFKIVPGKTASMAKNWLNSSSQTEATTFAFSSCVFILLLWSLYTVQWMVVGSPNVLCPSWKKICTSSGKKYIIILKLTWSGLRHVSGCKGTTDKNGANFAASR